MQFLEAKKNEVLEKLELEKIPKDFRELFKILLKKHCCKFSDLLLNKNCKIRSCKIYKNVEDFYNKYNTVFVKFRKKVYRFEIWIWQYPLDTEHSKVWFSNLHEFYWEECYSKEVDFSLERLYLICYYSYIKKGMQVFIYNGLSENDFDELLNNLDKLN